jgi:hypothetical protein
MRKPGERLDRTIRSWAYYDWERYYCVSSASKTGAIDRHVACVALTTRQVQVHVFVVEAASHVNSRERGRFRSAHPYGVFAWISFRAARDESQRSDAEIPRSE